MQKASDSLALGTTQLGEDFVFIVSIRDNGVPTTFRETHPSIPNQRALMIDLVPIFCLSPARPEIIFVADRSSSMSSAIDLFGSALNIFLQWLPVGLKFNICSLARITLSYGQRAKGTIETPLVKQWITLGASMRITVEQRHTEPMKPSLNTDSGTSSAKFRFLLTETFGIRKYSSNI